MSEPHSIRLPARLGALASLLVLGAAWAGRPSAQAAPRPGAAPLQMPTATPTPWLPDGAWQAVHGPQRAPLWTGGDGRNAMTCGEEDGTAGPKGSPAALCGVHGAQAPDGSWTLWAVGERGMLARWRDGKWTRLDDLSPAKTAPRVYHLHDVHVLAPDDVWAVGWVDKDPTCISEDGFCGAVLHYDGTRWAPEERSRMSISGCMAKLNAIDMLVDAQGTVGWAVGDKQCGNGGALFVGYDGARWRWTRVPQASRDLHDVKLVHRKDAWAVGEFGIEAQFYEPKTSPAWSVLGKSGADDLFALDLADMTYGWDGGDNGRLNRYVGTCHDEDQGTQCWFDNQASPVQNQSGQKQINNIYGIDLLSRTQGWLVGKPDGRQSFIAHFSMDKRWRSVSLDGDTGESLFGLFAASPSWAVAVGDEGTILEYHGAVAPTAEASGTPTVTPSHSPISVTPTIQATETSPSPTTSPPAPTDGTPTATASPTDAPTATDAPTLTLTPEVTPSQAPPSVTPKPWVWRAWLPRLVRKAR